MTISAVIIAKNEERNIGRCLEHLGFCDEIILIDDYSTDRTRIIAKKFGTKVFSRNINMDCSAQLNYGLSKAKGDWILFVDADEIISKKLATEILNSIKLDRYLGYYLKRKDFLWNKRLNGGETALYKDIRLIKKGNGKWKRRVHQKFEIIGKTNNLKNSILHYPHPTVKDFITSIDRWSSWHAIANEEEYKKSSIFKIIFFPKFHFFKNYLLNYGFVDGNRGFIAAIIMSFHSYLSWSKLWLLNRNK